MWCRIPFQTALEVRADIPWGDGLAGPREAALRESGAGAVLLRSVWWPGVPLLAAPFGLFVLFRYGSEAVVRLLAAVVAVTSRSDARAERALELLRLLRRDRTERDSQDVVRSGRRRGDN